MYQYGLDETAKWYFPFVFDALSTGCLLAIAQPHLNGYTKLLASRWMLVPISFTCVLPFLYRHPHIFNGVVVTAMNIGIALALDHSVRREYRILNVGPVVWIGTLSYSLYLWQQPFLNNDSPSLWTTFPINVILAFVAAILSFYLVEQPALRLRDRLESRCAAGSAVAVQRSAI
jgi:peptidoglycan/LPS O-acetylase OafA/YrhL